MNARPLITFLMTIFGIVTALPQVTITGNVEDADKQPLPGTVVRLYSEGRIKAFASAAARETVRFPSASYSSKRLGTV